VISHPVWVTDDAGNVSVLGPTFISDSDNRVGEWAQLGGYKWMYRTKRGETSDQEFYADRPDGMIRVSWPGKPILVDMHGVDMDEESGPETQAVPHDEMLSLELPAGIEVRAVDTGRTHTLRVPIQVGTDGESAGHIILASKWFQRALDENENGHIGSLTCWVGRGPVARGIIKVLRDNNVPNAAHFGRGHIRTYIVRCVAGFGVSDNKGWVTFDRGQRVSRVRERILYDETADRRGRQPFSRPHR
jgi:hypothetical protein